MSTPAEVNQDLTSYPDVPAQLRGKRTEHYWLWVLCLLGLDYFSTLAYQPSITFETAGRIGPIATGVVVLVTLTGALPVYWYLARRSPGGQGSIGLLERVVQGWRGKTLVLIMLGFAAVDFIMLKTISLADAAVHTLQSDDHGWQQGLSDLAHWLRGLAREHLGPEWGNYFSEQLVATLLLSVVGFGFWFVLRHGFNRNVMVLAVLLVGFFLALNALVLGVGLLHIFDHPQMIDEWLTRINEGDWLVEPALGQHWGWIGVILASFLILPKVALGLSGFELSMIVVPQVKGYSTDSPQEPVGRVRNTRKVLLLAVIVMSFYLLASSFVTCLLIPEREFRPGGKAVDRAIAYLAHGGTITQGVNILGELPWLGAVYDTVTVLVLCLTGTSVMTALSILLPQFLLRFGMELKWAHRWGVLLIVFALVNAGITLFYQASVTAQRDAYAVGVLALVSCAAMVTLQDKKMRWAARANSATAPLPRRLRLERWVNLSYFRIIGWGFVALTVVVVLRGFSGLAIAMGFIMALLAMSVVSRALRADELRTIGFTFKDDASQFLWNSLKLADFPVLVPHRPGRQERIDKERQIRRDHQLDPEIDIVFLEIELDDPSNFYQNLMVEILQEDHRYVIKVTRCVSVAHAIAAIALEMSRSSLPPGLHFGWSEMDLLTSSWSYLAFGEGNVPWKVRELLLQAVPEPEKRPRVIIG